MTYSYPLSSSFVELTKAVAQTPDNHDLKAAALNLLPPMKALAEEDPIAQYRLAKIYHQKSSSYWELMQASAKKGFTNAMLAMSRHLVESGTASELQEAVQYLVRIFCSEDSFIKNQAEAFMANHGQVGAEVKMQIAKIKRTATTDFIATKVDAKNDAHHHFPLQCFS